MSTARSSFFTLAALAITGCSSLASDGIETAEHATTVNPTTTGDLGTVTVKLPAGFAKAIVLDKNALEFRFLFEGTEIEPGVPTKVKAPQNDGHWGCMRITLGSSSRLLSQATECVWQLAPSGELTIELSTLKLWWTGYPQIESDIHVPGSVGTPRFSRTWQSNAWPQWWRTTELSDSWQLRTSAAYAFFQRNDIALPVLPGRYRYELAGSALAPIDLDIPPGVQVDANGSFDAYAAVLQVAFPDQEGFPNWLAGASVYCEGAPYPQDFERSGAVRVVIPTETATCKYWAAGFSGPLELRRGATTEAPLRRLNVAHVKVTDEGSAIEGRYRLERLEPVQEAPQMSAKTGTGVVVPPGKYRVIVDFNVHGEARQQIHEVNLP